MLERTKLAWKLWRLTKEPNARIWPAAVQCVKMIQESTPLQEAAKVETAISFCPYCGQRPQDDRRKDEARKLLVAMFPNEKRRTIDTVLSLAYWAATK